MVRGIGKYSSLRRSFYVYLPIHMNLFFVFHLSILLSLLMTISLFLPFNIASVSSHIIPNSTVRSSKKEKQFLPTFLLAQFVALRNFTAATMRLLLPSTNAVDSTGMILSWFKMGHGNMHGQGIQREGLMLWFMLMGEHLL